MNQDQIESLVRTSLKIVGSVLLTHGLTDQANLINSPDVCGAIVLLVSMWQSHKFHESGTTVVVTQPPNFSPQTTEIAGTKPMHDPLLTTSTEQSTKIN